MVGIHSSKSASTNTKEIVLDEVTSLLREVASLIKEDPKEAGKTIASIISLSETEKERAQIARDYITQHDALLAHVKKIQSDANDLLSNAEQRNREANYVEKQNSEKTASLYQKEQQLLLVSKGHLEKDRDHKKISEELSKKKEDLDVMEKSLNAREAIINAKQDSVLKHEEDMRNRAKNLKSLAEGF